MPVSSNDALPGSLFIGVSGSTRPSGVRMRGHSVMTGTISGVKARCEAVMPFSIRWFRTMRWTVGGKNGMSGRFEKSNCAETAKTKTRPLPVCWTTRNGWPESVLMSTCAASFSVEAAARLDGEQARDQQPVEPFERQRLGQRVLLRGPGDFGALVGREIPDAAAAARAGTCRRSIRPGRCARPGR